MSSIALLIGSSICKEIILRYRSLDSAIILLVFVSNLSNCGLYPLMLRGIAVYETRYWKIVKFGQVLNWQQILVRRKLLSFTRWLGILYSFKCCAYYAYFLIWFMFRAARGISTSDKWVRLSGRKFKVYQSPGSYTCVCGFTSEFHGLRFVDDG